MFIHYRKRWRSVVAAAAVLAASLGVLALVMVQTDAAPSWVPDALVELREPMRLQEPARIIDGDTLEVGGQQVRLLMVDTPERDQFCQSETGGDWLCGQSATGALTEKVGAVGAAIQRFQVLRRTARRHLHPYGEWGKGLRGLLSRRRLRNLLLNASRWTQGRDEN